MRRSAIFLLAGLAVLLPSLSAADDAHQAVEKELRKHFLKQVVTLRHFYTAKRLRFDSEGNLLDSATEGPWALYGLIQVSAVKLKEHQVVLEGTRLYVAFDDKQERVYYRSRDRVHIEVKYEPGDNLLLAANSCLNKVFLSSGVSLADVAPDYWKAFLKGEKVGFAFLPVPYVVGNGQNVFAPVTVDSVKNFTNPGPNAYRIGGDVSPPACISCRDPKYPEPARRARVEGYTVLWAVINTEGRAEDIRIGKARGMGLDDAAVETVRKWRFQPARRKGEPVRVYLAVEVNFHLTK